MRQEVRANKGLGQHFLSDPVIIDGIVRAIDPKEGQAMLEIGPGTGALTLPVLARNKAMTVVEFDSRMPAILQAKAQGVGDLRIIQGDILDQDLNALFHGKPYRIIGNLPYNLSSAILFHCLLAKSVLIDMHFMLQKEVVERMVALPDDPNYGRLSVMLQRCFAMQWVMDVPPDAFSPPPKVDSAIVRCLPYETPPYPIDNETLFAIIVQQAFSQRRKMIRRSLEAYISSQQLETLGINPESRPQNLSGEEFAHIANFINRRGHG